MSSEQKSKVRRILLKISGEALSGESGFGIDPKVLSETAKLSETFRNRVSRPF